MEIESPEQSRQLTKKLRAFTKFCWVNILAKGAITSKIKHAIKHKTSPARLAQLLRPSLAFCFSLQPMTEYRPVRTCFMFYCMFYFTCDRSLNETGVEAQTTLGARHFFPKINVWKINKMPEFYIIARKILFLIFWRGRQMSRALSHLPVKRDKQLQRHCASQ